MAFELMKEQKDERSHAEQRLITTKGGAQGHLKQPRAPQRRGHRKQSSKFPKAGF